MEKTFLCHSCFERNDKDAPECNHCNVKLKTVNEEREVDEFIRSLTQLADGQRLGNPREFRLAVSFNFFLSFNFLIIATFLYLIYPYYEAVQLWFVIAFYVMTVLSMVLSMRLISRRRSAIRGVIFLLPLQLALLIAFIVDLKIMMIQNAGGMLPAWIENLHNWPVYLMFYCIGLSVLYSMQVYYVLFNYQVRRQLVF